MSNCKHDAAEQYCWQCLQARLDEAEAKLANSEQWRRYYRAKWLGDEADEKVDRPADSAPAVACEHCGATDRHFGGCYYAGQRVTL